MGRNGQSDRLPIQTSAVIVLGVKQGPALPPPSPPTPCASPSDNALLVEGPSGSFSLEESTPRHVADSPPSASRPLCHHETVKEAVETESRLRQGMHVLNTEALALANLSKLYETDSIARAGFDQAVQTIARRCQSNGKVVIIGVGKSGHIGKKLVATMQSLGIRAVFLHPTEALHGDLGIIDPRDTLLFVTFSGKTQEIMLLLPHLDEALPTILLTSHIRRDTCELIRQRPGTILLPAPIPESETISFGVSAPTSSTTVALALGDALAITTASEMHQNIAATFAKNHPGGAIGEAAVVEAAAAAAASTSVAEPATKRPRTLKDVCVLMDDIPYSHVLGLTGKSPAIELLRAAVDNRSGCIRAQPDQVAVPSQIRQISSADLHQPLAQLPNMFVSLRDMLAMSSDTTIRQAGDMVRSMQQRQKSSVVGGEALPCGSPDVISVTEGGKIIGVVEAHHLFESHKSCADGL
ncbi:hypothetical protein E4U21_003763 [Claviceps maximensis]|nr:hypothetical protein E4U21_003763 [Claviceps maximensis]